MNVMKETIEAVKQYLFLLKDGISLKLAIMLADAKQRAHNKRYYVMPDANNKLVVLNNDDIRRLQTPQRYRRLVNGKLKTRKYYMMNPNATHLDVMRECFYYTKTSLNDKASAMGYKERAARADKWLLYMERERNRKLIKKGKRNGKKV